MSDVATSSAVTDAYLTALRTLGRPVGDAVKPPSPNPAPKSFYPYGVLYVGTVRLEGTYVDPYEDGLHRLQVTSVGLDRAGAESLRDQVRPILLDGTIDINGHAAVWAELVSSLPIVRDDDVTPALFYAVDVVNVLVTPASSGS